MPRTRVLLLATQLLATAASASEFPEGEYVLTYREQAPGGRAEEVTQCLTAETPVPRPPARAGTCKVLDASTVGAAAMWRVECKGPASEGGGSLTVQGGVASGMLMLEPVLKGGGKGAPVIRIIEGRWVGGCGGKPRPGGEQEAAAARPAPSATPQAVSPGGGKPLDSPTSPERFFTVEKWGVELDEHITGTVDSQHDFQGSRMRCVATAELSAQGLGPELYTPPPLKRDAKVLVWEGELKLTTNVLEKWECFPEGQKNPYGFTLQGNGSPLQAMARLSIDTVRKTYTFQVKDAGRMQLKGTLHGPGYKTSSVHDQTDALDFIHEHQPLPAEGYEITGYVSQFLPPYQVVMQGPVAGPFPRKGGYALRPHRKAVCGPDITQTVRATMDYVRGRFAKRSTQEKVLACKMLTDALSGPVSWDMEYMHSGLEWLERVRPECASKGETPSCAGSVEMDGQCFFAGSVNYVLWGTAMRLCYDYHPAPLNKVHSREMTLGLVSVHKLKGIPGFESANLVPAREWAAAGWDGWPRAPTPSGDRPNCKCECPREYSDRIPQNPDGTLPVSWLPYKPF